MRLPALAALVVAALLLPQAPSAPRDRQLFDFDWRFKPGDVENGQSVPMDDAAWEKVDLPHDFAIRGQGQAIVIPNPTGRAGQPNPNLPTAPEGPFDPRSPGRSDNGYLNTGLGWYRKTFTLPAAASAKRVFIEFEGVYMNSDVWLNGEKLGSRPYGYSTFEYELTPLLKFGGATNVLAVRVNVQQPSTRWYSGAGIYRHVWLTTTNPVHVDHWGMTVSAHEITDAKARVHVRVALRNQSAAAAITTSEVVILDAGGKPVARGSVPVTLQPGADAPFDMDISVPTPHRWGLVDPYLYTAEVHVRNSGRDLDVVRTPFGIRTITISADSSLMVNGIHVPLRGVCLHHDLGPLGAAAFDRGIERQLEIMKRMGVNAIRTSHNPPAPALLDAADRMGFVVMDEAFDEWKRNKTRFGYGQFFDEWSERDIRDYVRRDRNHPSIVMWSIGNEIPEQGDTTRVDGVTRAQAMAARLAALVRMEDTTRFLTSAMNSPQRALGTGFATALDIFGVNYNLGVYPTVRGRPSYGSETSSDFSSRDQYNLVLDGDTLAIKNHLDNHVTSYDLEGPGWGNSAEVQFAAMRTAPWIGGEFVWTGFDYIGEPTPFSWPNRSSSFGIVDLVGFPKDRFYLYQSQWRPETPMVHILPHWTWPDNYRGKSIPVWAYTNADSVELFLNGKSLGSRNWKGVNIFHLEWKVPYEPGLLRAVARKAGKVVAEDRIETTTAAVKLELVPDRTSIDADGQDLSFVTVRAVDAKGRLVRSGANQLVKFTLTGAGSIAGIDNGDPTNHEAFVGPTPLTAQHKLFNGLQMIVIRAPRKNGSMTLEATADGLVTTKVSLQAR